MDKDDIETFVCWLINYATPEERYLHRQSIVRCVRLFGKSKVLDEITRQSRNFKNVAEAVIVTRLVREVK